jgi:hypothetical protein
MKSIDTNKNHCRKKISDYLRSQLDNNNNNNHNNDDEEHVDNNNNDDEDNVDNNNNDDSCEHVSISVKRHYRALNKEVRCYDLDSFVVFK